MKNIKGILIVFGILLLLSLVLSACGGSQPDPPVKKPQVAVDSTIKPAMPEIPGVDDGPSRPVGRLIGPFGGETDLVLNEVIVMTDDQAKLDSFLKRWQGVIIKETNFKDIGVDVAKVYLVKIDPSSATVSTIGENLQKHQKGATGDSKVSNDATAKLLAVVAEELARNELSVSLNPVMPNQGSEHPTGGNGYTADACQWPYMNSGSPQNFGVCAAQALVSQFVNSSAVNVMVIDRGFSLNQDFPGATMNPATAWGVPNLPGACHGNNCTWHGNDVLSTLAGVADNNFGIAGSGAPAISQVTLATSTHDMFVGTIDGIARAISSAATERPRIANLSFSFIVDEPWAAAVSIGNVIFPAIRSAGILVFAAAGNQNVDVDRLGWIFDNESQSVVPCEFNDVVCVGGLGWNAITKGDSSNFGTRQRNQGTASTPQDGSVDIYGPFTVWGGINPERTQPDKINGTSFSSPFVAGVAALIWSVNPALTPTQVERILLTTAIPTPDVDNLPAVQTPALRVSAVNAVQSIVGNAPTIGLGNGPLTVNVGQSFTVTATVSDVEDGSSCCAVTWNPAPNSTTTGGKTASYRFDTEGTRRITAKAQDSAGLTTTATLQVNVGNRAPIVTINSPVSGVTLYRGQPYLFSGSAIDPDEGNLDCSSLTWRGPSDAGFPKTGCDVTVTFTVNGREFIDLVAKDSQNKMTAKTIVLTVVDPPAIIPPSITSFSVTPTGALDYQEISLSASISDPDNRAFANTWSAWKKDDPANAKSIVQNTFSTTFTPLDLFGSGDYTLIISFSVNYVDANDVDQTIGITREITVIHLE